MATGGVRAAVEKVQYVELLPHEFRERLAERPVGYLPLGTLEWHGEQNALGADALLSHALFTRAAERFGGVVFPPLFLGPDRARREADGTVLIGMDTADVTVPPRQLEGSCYWISRGLFLQLVEGVLTQAQRAGFRVVVADGHGIEGEWRSQVDHAGKNETSLMLAHYPALVDLGQLPPDRSVWPQGVAGDDPRDATAQHGEECIAASLALIAAALGESGY